MDIRHTLIDIKHILKPHKTSASKYRLGTNGDGGYIISDLKNISYDALYSYGSDDNISFEKAFYSTFNVESFTYDHTINAITDKHDYVHFFKEGVGGRYDPTGPVNTIESHVINNNHTKCNNLFMQMDVEGHEWESLYVTPDHILDKFAQIVLEMHFFIDPRASLETLKKLDKNFVITHIHGNNYPVNPWVDINLPKVIEVTFVRKDLVEIYEVDTDPYPTPLDSPNMKGFPDLKLDWWLHTYELEFP